MNDTDKGNTTMAGSEVPDTPAIDSKLLSEQVVGAESVEEQILPMQMTALSSIPQTTKVPAPANPARLPLEMMLDVPITLIFEVGRTDITIKQLMELREGSYVELRHVSVDSIDVRINEKIIAQAETIALQQRYGIRFGEVEMFSGLESEDESV